MKTQLKGVLEIDHDRGVVYFHLSDEKDIMELGTQTVLRLCHLPTPIPAISDKLLDIIHMHGASWI